MCNNDKNKKFSYKKQDFNDMLYITRYKYRFEIGDMQQMAQIFLW